MLEQDYINVQHLTRVRLAEENLRFVVVGLSLVIPPEEYRTVMRLLEKWTDALYKEIKITQT